MKIMTFNTQHCQNYLVGTIDFSVMAEAILQCGAEVVGLNEMRGKGISEDYEAQTERLSELTGLDNYYFAKAVDISGKGPYGNALLSKHKILKAETILIPDSEPDYETRCVLKAVLDNSLTVLITHFGLDEAGKKNAVDTVLQHLETERCVLMGDFNVEPDDRILAPIRAKLKDTAECFEKPLWSFPSDKPDIKIDYIFVTPDIEVVRADIPAIVASDHRPHTAEIKF